MESTLIDEHGNIFCDNPRCSPQGVGKRIGMIKDGVAVCMIICPRCGFMNIVDTRVTIDKKSIDTL